MIFSVIAGLPRQPEQSHNRRLLRHWLYWVVTIVTMLDFTVIPSVNVMGRILSTEILSQEQSCSILFITVEQKYIILVTL